MNEINITTATTTTTTSKLRKHEFTVKNLIELGLDGRRVDALIVEELLDALGDAAVVGQVAETDVCRRNDPAAGQLPDVELVHSEHAVNLERISKQEVWRLFYTTVQS